MAGLEKALYDATKSSDWTLAEELLKKGARVDYDVGGGSTFFNAVQGGTPPSIFEHFLTAPGIERVVNGTGSSWQPIADAFVIGRPDLAMSIMDHSCWSPCTSIPWQLESFVIRESLQFRKHPDSIDCDYAELLSTVETFFTRCEFEQSYNEWFKVLLAQTQTLAELIPGQVFYGQFKDFMTRVIAECDEDVSDEALERNIEEAFNEKCIHENGTPYFAKKDLLDIIKEFIGGDDELCPDKAINILEACFSRVLQINEVDGQLVCSNLNGDVLFSKCLDTLQNKKVAEVLSLLRDGCSTDGGKLHFVLAGQPLEKVDQETVFVDLFGQQ